MSRASETLRHWWQLAAELIWPSACAGCGRPGGPICPRCRANLPWMTGPMCDRCGRALAYPAERCWACRHARGGPDQVRATFRYSEPISTLIHQLKYRGGAALAGALADLLVARPITWARPPELIVPVPLYPARERERGYNQARLLGEQLGRRWGLPLARDAVRRTRHTTPQVSLDGARRQENVRGAFAAGDEAVAGKGVLIVDDVYTTGATMSAVAETLCHAGAVWVGGYCLARTGQGGQTSEEE